MTKPIPGLCVPCSVKRIIDGDTVVVTLRDAGCDWKIRLIDTWAPELKEKGGPESKAWVESYVKKHAGEETLVHIPWPKKHKANPLSHLTMERIPGFIWIGNGCLNELIVSNGHATKTKGPK